MRLPVDRSSYFIAEMQTCFKVCPPSPAAVAPQDQSLRTPSQHWIAQCFISTVEEVSHILEWLKGELHLLLYFNLSQITMVEPPISPQNQGGPIHCWLEGLIETFVAVGGIWEARRQVKVEFPFNQRDAPYWSAVQNCRHSPRDVSAWRTSDWCSLQVTAARPERLSDAINPSPLRFCLYILVSGTLFYSFLCVGFA